jgi:hypothetical protein
VIRQWLKGVFPWKKSRLAPDQQTGPQRRSRQSVRGGDEMPERAEDTIRSMYDAFARADIPAILNALDDQIDWCSP